MYKLVKGIIYGLLIIIASFFFIFSLTGNPYDEYLLITNGITSEAVITGIGEDVQENDGGGDTYYYNISYKFNLPDGQLVKSGQQLSSGTPQNIPDVSSLINIVYLESNPQINKIKNTLSQSTFEIIWKKIGLGTILFLLLSTIGLVIIRQLIREYNLTKTAK